MTLQAPDWENSSNSVYTWSRYRLTGFAAAHDRRTFQFPDLLKKTGRGYHPINNFMSVAYSTIREWDFEEWRCHDLDGIVIVKAVEKV